jgi:hypothetical protein
MGRHAMGLSAGIRPADLVTLGALAEHVPMTEVRSAIQEHGVGGQRRRSLPAELTALFVVAMCLYREVSYVEVLRCLLEGMRWLGFDVSGAVATKGAITQARERLGWKCVHGLYRRLAKPIAVSGTKGAWYRGWRTVVIDGSTLDVADTEENVEAFGYPAASRGSSAFPKIRMAVLCETGTHVVFACAMGAFAQGEVSLSAELLPHLKPGMLLLADRGFMGFDLWRRAAAAKADLLWRARENHRLEPETRLPDGSFLSRIYASPNDLRTGTGGIQVRVIEYTIEGSSELYRLLTTILDPELAPAGELAALYHERWEVESVFDEIKTHLEGAGVVLRSKKPDLVQQEFWGLMVAHLALRGLMHEAAVNQGWDPDQISFVHTLRIVKRTMPSRLAISPPMPADLA